MSLIDRLNDDLKEAQKAKDQLRLTLIRSLKSDLKYKEIDKGDSLTDEDVLAVISSAAKKRRDSFEQFKAGNRIDLADQEEAELKLISAYLPEQLSEENITEIVTKAISETGAKSAADMGVIMKVVMPEVKGRADGNQVRKVVSQLLSSIQS